jgi:hypothetical protein
MQTNADTEFRCHEHLHMDAAPRSGFGRCACHVAVAAAPRRRRAGR